MIGALLTTVFAWFTSTADADALRSTAPTYLTTETAREHLAAARIAGAVTGTDPNLLLSISWHESRYEVAAVTKEIGNKVSCGPMTAEPTRDLTACRLATSSPLAGYLVGAQHLRGWIDATHNLHAALLGFAGGYVGIAYCRDLANAHDYRCFTPQVFLGRAHRIRAAMTRARLATS